MSNRYVDASDSDEWKEKYLESLEVQEKVEKIQESRMDLLRRGLVGVSLAADGVDENLDDMLSDLRNLLRSSKAIDEMRPVLQNIEATVRRLDDSKQLNHHQLLNGFESIVNQLNELEPSRKIKSQIKDFASHLNEDIKDQRNHGRMMNRVSLIQAETLESLRAQAEAEEQSADEGFFKKLLTKKIKLKKNSDESDDSRQQLDDPNDASGTPQPEARMPESFAFHEAQDRYAISEEATPEAPLSRHVKNFADNLSDTYEGEAVRERVGGIMLTLLDQLIICPSDKIKEEHIRSKISEGLRWPEIPVTLSESVSLVSRSQLEAQKDTEIFLHDLNGKLKEIENFLVFNEQSIQHRNKNSTLLTDTVNDHIKAIQDNMHDLDNSVDLRRVIGEQIDFIAQAMASFNNEEKIIETISEDKISILIERIDALEKKSDELKEIIAEQNDRVFLDSLTEIPNRLAYDRRSGEEYARWQRYQSPLSLAVADIDLFKHINDTYGHVAGDRVLRVIAKLLCEDLRDADFICRYGGEEFVVIFPETEAEIAALVLEKIRTRVASCPFHFKKAPVQITVSFGLSEFIEGDTVVSVFKRADKALYEAKELGRNKVIRAD